MWLIVLARPTPCTTIACIAIASLNIPRPESTASHAIKMILERPLNTTPLEEATKGAKPPAPAANSSDDYGNMHVGDMVLEHSTVGNVTGATYGV